MAIAMRYYELGDASCAVSYERKGYMIRKKLTKNRPSNPQRPMYLIRRLMRGSIRLKTINHSKRVDMDMRSLFILWNSQSGLNPVPRRNRIAKAQFLTPEWLTHKDTYHKPRQPDSGDEDENILEEDSPKVPIVKDYSLVEANIPPDRASEIPILW